MPYIGNTIRAADDYRLIDDISSGFNGSETSFALQVAGSAPVPFPKSPQQVLISVNGVIQEPDPTGSSGFNLVGTNIVFSSAPTNGHAFFGIIYATADYLNAGGNFPAGSLGAPSITFIGDENTGLFRKSGGSVGFVSDATEIANFDSNGITISSGNIIIPDSIIHNGDTNTKIRFPAADTVTIETGGTQRLFLGNADTVFNETGADVNLRIESDGNANCFTLDAGKSGIGINQEPATGYGLDILGNSGYDDVIRITGVGTNIGPRFNLTPTGTGVGRINATANSLQLQTGGTTAITIDTSQKVGIGTTSPSDKLHVRGASAAFTTFILDNATNSSSPYKITYGDQGQVNHLVVANRELTFGTNNAERMRIANDGALTVQKSGVFGNTSDSFTALSITSSTSGISELRFADTTANAGFIKYEHTANNLIFATASSERMRLDTSGRVLIGHSTGNGFQTLSVSGNTGGSSGAGMLFLRRGLDRATIGSNVGADLGEVDFGDLDGNIYASIQGKTDAATGSNDFPGRIILATTADGGSSPSERMRIDSSGKVGIGTSSPSKKLEVSGAIFANGGTLQASLQGDITNQLNPALVLTSSSNTSMRANFLLQDDFPSGRGSLAINTTESGVTNDRDLLLQRSGGRVAVGGGEPAVGLHYFGSEFRHENSSIPFIRLKSTNAQGSNHGDYGRLINDVAGTVTGLLDWKRQSATDDSYFTIFNKSNSNNIQERLRITSRGTLCVHANQQTNLNNMNVDSVSMPKYFENTGAQDSSLVGADIHFQTIVRGTSGSSDTLFTFQGGGNCGFFCEITAYFSSAVSNFQGRQRMWWRAFRTGNQNFSLTQAHNYDKVGTATNVYFNPLWTSSGSGANQVLGVKVNSVNMGAYVRFWFVARIIVHDNMNSMTINR